MCGCNDARREHIILYRLSNRFVLARRAEPKRGDHLQSTLLDVLYWYSVVEQLYDSTGILTDAVHAMRLSAAGQGGEDMRATFPNHTAGPAERLTATPRTVGIHGAGLAPWAAAEAPPSARLGRSEETMIRPGHGRR